MTQLDVQYIRYSTEGSVARQYLPVFPKKRTASVAKPRTHKRIRVYVDPVAIFGTAVAVCMLVMMFVGVFQFRAAQQENAAMAAYVTSLSAENKALENEFNNGYDLENVRQTALALGLVPQESVRQVALPVPQVQQAQQTNFIERIGTFLAGLFA